MAISLMGAIENPVSPRLPTAQRDAAAARAGGTGEPAPTGSFALDLAGSNGGEGAGSAVAQAPPGEPSNPSDEKPSIPLVLAGAGTVPTGPRPPQAELVQSTTKLPPAKQPLALTDLFVTGAAVGEPRDLFLVAASEPPVEEEAETAVGDGALSVSAAATPTPPFPAPTMPAGLPIPLPAAPPSGEPAATQDLNRADASGDGTAAVTTSDTAAGSAQPRSGFEAMVAAIAPDGALAGGAATDATSLAASLPSLDASLGGQGQSRQLPSPSASAESKAATAAQPPAQPTPAPVPLGAVPMTIGLRALGAANRFEIRLDPAELGRIDVALDIDRDRATVGARLVVERPETLALLQRDASSLQQALAQAGLDASEGIALSLRGDGEGRQGGEPGAERQARGAAAEIRGSQAAPDTIGLDLVPLRALRRLGGIDIRI